MRSINTQRSSKIGLFFLKKMNRLKRIGCGARGWMGGMIRQWIKECFTLRSTDSGEGSSRRGCSPSIFKNGSKLRGLEEGLSLNKIWLRLGIDKSEWLMGTNSSANHLWVEEWKFVWSMPWFCHRSQRIVHEFYLSYMRKSGGGWGRSFSWMFLFPRGTGFR